MGIVVDEFSEGKELVSIVLLIVTKDAGVLLKDLVDMLSLAVCLGVECSGLITFYVA